jgi:tetratricopeptide (TPR) repeat protein
MLEIADARPLVTGEGDALRDASQFLLEQARADDNDEEIVALSRRRLRDNPFDADSFLDQVQGLRRLGRADEALALCRDWIRRSPVDPLPRHAAADILLQQRLLEPAVTQIEALAQIERRRPPAAGPVDADLISVDAAAWRRPRLERLWFRAAQCAEQLDRKAEALLFYRQCIETAPRTDFALRAQNAVEALDATGGGQATPQERRR